MEFENKQAPAFYGGAIQDKWGTAVLGGRAGFQAVPDVLLRKQGELGITNTELVVLLNILMHWWEKDGLPYPPASIIAKRMNVQKRTVQRATASLVVKGIVIKLSGNDAKRYRKYDPSPLVERLQGFADEYQSFNPETRRIRDRWDEQKNSIGDNATMQ